MLNLFAATINISPLSGGETIFGREGIKKYKIIKFRFAPNCQASASTRNAQWE